MRNRAAACWVGIAVVVGVSLAACGGDDDGGVEAEEAGATSASGGDAPSDAPNAGSSSLAENTAVVVIGDRRYEFDVTPGAVQRCDPNFFGAFWALGARVGGDGNVELLLPPVGDPNFPDPATAKVVDDDEDLEWSADPMAYAPEVPAGSMQVDEYTVDGNVVTGTATFVELNAVYAASGAGTPPPAPVVGTFEVHCAPS